MYPKAAFLSLILFFLVVEGAIVSLSGVPILLLLLIGGGVLGATAIPMYGGDTPKKMKRILTERIERRRIASLPPPPPPPPTESELRAARIAFQEDLLHEWDRKFDKGE